MPRLAARTRHASMQAKLGNESNDYYGPVSDFDQAPSQHISHTLFSPSFHGSQRRGKHPHAVPTRSRTTPALGSSGRVTRKRYSASMARPMPPRLPYKRSGFRGYRGIAPCRGGAGAAQAHASSNYRILNGDFEGCAKGDACRFRRRETRSRPTASFTSRTDPTNSLPGFQPLHRLLRRHPVGPGGLFLIRVEADQCRDGGDGELAGMGLDCG